MKKLISLVLTLCMLAALAVPAMAAGFTAGTYTATAKGNNGDLTVEVTFSADKIVDVVVTNHVETPGLADPALTNVPAAIKDTQSLTVDTVAGATVTSKAIIAAVEDCVKQAGGDPAALTAAAAAEEIVKEEKEMTADVVVVGAGMAGMASALSAVENGAKVILIDKMAVTGGTTNLAGGILVCVDSQLFEDDQMAADNMDSVLAYWDTHMAQSGVDSGYPDRDRLVDVLSNTGKTVDWFVENGIEFSGAPYAASSTYPMALANGGGAGLIKMLEKCVTDKGVELITECKATELVTDEAGAVVGVIAETKDAVITFKADSVVLCTGGISQNQELVAKYSPKLARAGLIPTSAVSHTGDGFLMALEVGAGTFDVFATPLYTTTFDPALKDATGLSLMAQLGVNANGDRFANEAAAAGWDMLDYTASDMIQDGNAPFWYVFDSSDAAIAAVLEAGAADGVVAKGNTAAELAVGMHVYTKNFVKAFEEYNAAAAAGEDKQFGKAAMFLKELKTAPFYAVKVYPTTFGSSGGVTTTAEGRVTTQDGTVITGLYAAGEMSNRYFYNENYILAASLGLYSTMGRRAGAAAAQDALAK
ncbi:MAG: FAD-dependent oxidoreductase [Clostridia bacterium]|nr:FAD-dependent oxidoreductase [Clostridia bacterium]